MPILKIYKKNYNRVLTQPFPIVRFAPSPTGFLHLGNARIALFNWVFSQKNTGIFILRIDDTDQERSEFTYIQALKKDLRWLGLNWDICFSQSSREQFYAPYIHQLKHSGHLYPCCETPQELEAQREELRLLHRSPVFNKETRKVDATRAIHWRFSLKKCKVSWKDGIQGMCEYDTSHISDPIVIRENGSLSYLLTSVLDDQDPKHPVTHIIRGLDHYVNTAIQYQMFEALGTSCPVFIHLPLLQHESGEKFSKRTQGQGIQDWRSAGALPESLSEVLLNLSCEHPLFTQNLKKRIEHFSWDMYSKASEVRLSPETVWKASNAYFSIMSWKEVQARIDFTCIYLTEAHWKCIAQNIYSFLDVQSWDRVFDPQWHSALGEVEAVCNDLLKDKVYLEAVFFQWGNALKNASHDFEEGFWKELWHNWTTSLHRTLSIRRSVICSTLRWIITGRTKGPPMVDVLRLLGNKSIEHRLKALSVHNIIQQL